MNDAPLVTPVNPKTLSPEISHPPVKKEVVSVSGSPTKPYIWFTLVILAGIFTGFLFSRIKPAISPDSAATAAGQDLIKTETEIGSTDTKTFRDTATGMLETGGINGEGTHKLIRPGGSSQTVYLVSSIIDLDEYSGKQVEVWGETLQAKRAGWLMDVGRLKIVE